MKISKKPIIVVIATILMGAVGSALWDILLKPIYLKSGDLLINIATLGVGKIKDSLYLDIAKGFHESVSLEILAFLWAFIISLPLSTLLMMLFYKHVRKITIRFRDIIHRENSETKSHKVFKIFFILYIIFFLTVSFFEIFKTGYINNSITHYNQLFTATAPHIDDSEEEIIKSNFSQIRNQSNYDSIINKLQEIANKEGIIIDKK